MRVSIESSEAVRPDGYPEPSRRSWWSETKPRTAAEKPPSSSSSLRPSTGWRLIASNSSSVSLPGLFRMSSGTESLPMSCSSPADGQVAACGRRQLELLADLGGEQGDAAGVLLGRDVGARDPHHQGADARAEVGLLAGDQLRGLEVTDQRARSARALDVQRGGEADERD